MDDRDPLQVDCTGLHIFTTIYWNLGYILEIIFVTINFGKSRQLNFALPWPKNTFINKWVKKYGDIITLFVCVLLKHSKTLAKFT